jgi:hypothetical protein
MRSTVEALASFALGHVIDGRASLFKETAACGFFSVLAGYVRCSGCECGRERKRE